MLFICSLRFISVPSACIVLIIVKSLCCVILLIKLFPGAFSHSQNLLLEWWTIRPPLLNWSNKYFLQQSPPRRLPDIIKQLHSLYILINNYYWYSPLRKVIGKSLINCFHIYSEIKCIRSLVSLNAFTWESCSYHYDCTYSFKTNATLFWRFVQYQRLRVPKWIQNIRHII